VAATALAVAVALALAACGDGDGGTGGGAPELPPCAADLALPAGLEVAEVTATPSPSNPTCAVTLASSEPVDELVAAWRAALDGAGVAHEVRHEPGRRAIVRLDGPVCGSILVFAAGTERVTDAVAADRTPAIASVLPCDGA
jgi:hypothetical protein